MRNYFQKLFIIVVVAFLAATTQLVFCQDGLKGQIRIKGSESTAWMVDAYAKEFMKINPNVNIAVSGGQGVGWQAFLNKETEIGMSSRALTDEERAEAAKRGIGLKEKLIGWGGIVIIVHPQNPVNELTVDQVKKIFNGECSKWNDVGGLSQSIDIFTIGEDLPGTLHYMQKNFLQKSLAPNAITKTFFKGVISGVAEDPAAASFVRVRNILQLAEVKKSAEIKVVAVKRDAASPAVLPSRETVDNGTYPITRPYYIYYDEKILGQSGKDFADFSERKNPRSL